MDDHTASTGMVKCPWCAEEILAEAKKCKHCGEFLTDEMPHHEDVTPETDLIVDDDAAALEPAETTAVWEYVGRHCLVGAHWSCVAHGKVACTPCIKISKHPIRGKEGDLFGE